MALALVDGLKAKGPCHPGQSYGLHVRCVMIAVMQTATVGRKRKFVEPACMEIRMNSAKQPLYI